MSFVHNHPIKIKKILKRSDFVNSKMALERFLTKKLDDADESNWLLKDSDGEGQQGGYREPKKRIRPAKW